MSYGQYPGKLLEVKPLPNDLNYDIYSSLIGLLATNGASLQLGYMWFWDYSTVYLRLSHPNPVFLTWLVNYFQSPGFNFQGKYSNKVSSSNSIQVGSLPSILCYILWLHWNEQGVNVFPLHFAHYFSIRTLAFWAMRNGQWTGNSFLIHVGGLNDSEKAELMSLIKNKLGFDSRLTMKMSKLAISNPSALVEQLKPFFHSSQMHRLEKRS